jgi:hypothetical protein
LFLATRKFDPIPKDRLFYDQFEYCLNFYLPEANCLRLKDHALIDDTIDRRRQWREAARQRWAKGQRNHSTDLGRFWHDITESTVKDLHTVTDFLLNNNSDYKLVVTVNHGYIYTNDLKFLDQLSELPQLTCKGYTQALVTRAKNTVQLKNPRHAFRSYFRSIKLTEQQKHHLTAFLQGQKEQIRPSPALTRWLDMPFNYVQDYFFVDHDTESWLTMLGLVCPQVIRKTLQIQQAK